MKNLTLLIKPAAGACNMNCAYCFYRAASEKRDNRPMTKATVDTLIHKIRAYQPTALHILFQGGEPTLAGLDFFEYFVQTVQSTLQVPVDYALQTNGLLVDEAFAAFFQKHRFLIGVSLDGDRKTNDRYRLDNDGESVHARVLAACDLLKKHGVDFNILSVIDHENAKELARTWAFFKEHGFRYLQFIPYVDEGSGVSLTAEAYGAFLKQSFALWCEEWAQNNYISVRHIDNYIRILMGDPPENCAMCGVCGSYFVVEANGDLYPCDFYCTPEYRLGSIFEEAPFAVRKQQSAFIEQSYLIHESCGVCQYHFLCRGGCRRDRTDGGTKNKYCAAYKAFFADAADRMAQIARDLQA